MLLVEKLLRLYERVKADNKHCEVDAVEVIESLVKPEVVSRLIDAEKYEYVPVGYQWRARSIRSQAENGWGNWSLCDETRFRDYKKHPFVGGWQFEACEVFVKRAVAGND